MGNFQPKLHLFALHALCFFALLGTTAGKAPAQAFPDSPYPDGTYDFTSAQSGSWHDPQTWGSKSSIPGTDDSILIQDGHTVTLSREEPARHYFIRVEGELRLWTAGDTRLLVETLYIFGDGDDIGSANEGVLRIGYPATPLPPGRKAEIVFTSSGAINPTWDIDQQSRGLVSKGIIRLFGAEKTAMIPAPNDLPAGSDSYFLEPPWGGWEEDDELVVAGTFFQRVPNPILTSSQDERVTLTTQTGDVFEFSPPLTFDHESVGNRPFHIVNLTRNIVLKSESSTPVSNRGHVMFQGPDVHIENAAFVDLGRTDKRIPLDDRVITIIQPDLLEPPTDYNITTPAPAQILNRRGRYALHFHLNGIQPQLTDPPSKVYGSVVDGTVGWGFVNHSSHVDFQRNVAYNFAGAGFVTELGDELGNFFDNIAIRGTGNAQYRKSQVVFKNGQRPQPLSDFAFSGDGFWFQGPALRVKNNIASGCDGAGMMWFTTGAPDIGNEYPENGYTHNRYSHFPRSALIPVYGSGLVPRYWIHSDSNEKLVIADLPILELENFTAYGNFVGFRLRFNNHDSVDWYREDAFDYHDDIVPVCEGSNRCAVRERQTLDHLTLWNNEQAFRMRYVTDTDWNQVDAINRLDYESLNPIDGRDGAEFRFNLTGQHFTDLSIDGYPVAGWIQYNSADLVRPEITFSPGSPTYSNNIHNDTWILPPAPNTPPDPLLIECGVPTSVLVLQSSSQITSLIWQAGTNNSNYLLRYKPQAEQQWQFHQASSESAILTGLTSGSLYDVQIGAGCSVGSDERTVSNWTATVSFTPQDCPFCQ